MWMERRLHQTIHELPRLLSSRLTSALALGCALLAFTSSAHAQRKFVPLTEDGFTKATAAAEALAKDPAAKAEYKKMAANFDIIDAAELGKEIPANQLAKYPTAVAALKEAGTTPDEFLKFWIAFAYRGATADANPVAKANDEYCKANEDQVKDWNKALTALMN